MKTIFILDLDGNVRAGILRAQISGFYVDPDDTGEVTIELIGGEQHIFDSVDIDYLVDQMK